MIDTSKVQRIHPNYWRNSQLSISRFYGGCMIQGRKHIHDLDTDELVREDVYKRDMQEKEKKARIARAEKKKWMSLQQPKLGKEF